MTGPDSTATATPGAGPLDAATLHALGRLGLAARAVPRLAAMVAALLGRGGVEVLDARLDTHPYPYPALTTRERVVVSGTVAAVLPWRTEPDLYRSDLGDRLPAGLTVPHAFGVHDLDDDSAAIWLELVPGRPAPWDLDRHRRAAHLLGRLAANPSVAPLATRVPPGRTARGYADVWLAQNVIPDLRDDDVWRRPLVADAFDADLRARTLAAVDALPRLLDELDSFPTATAHGDACTRNLLGTDGTGFVMIDFGFWGTAPVGFDLGQLLLGEVHAGERPARDLPELERACVPAYVDGLRDEGYAVTFEQVRRCHALLMTIHYAIPALPFEHRDAAPTPALHRLHAERAAATRFVLDRLDATTWKPLGQSPAGSASQWCAQLLISRLEWSSRRRTASARTGLLHSSPARIGLVELGPFSPGGNARPLQLRGGRAEGEPTDAPVLRRPDHLVRGRPANRQNVPVNVADLQRSQFTPPGTGVQGHPRQERDLLATVQLGSVAAGRDSATRVLDLGGGDRKIRQTASFGACDRVAGWTARA